MMVLFKCFACFKRLLFSLNLEQDELETKEFSGSRTIKLSAILTGGKGNVAWQHAQVFRQPADSEEYPFQITFTLKKI